MTKPHIKDILKGTVPDSYQLLKYRDSPWWAFNKLDRDFEVITITENLENAIRYMLWYYDTYKIWLLIKPLKA